MKSCRLLLKILANGAKLHGSVACMHAVTALPTELLLLMAQLTCFYLIQCKLLVHNIILKALLQPYTMLDNSKYTIEGIIPM